MIVVLEMIYEVGVFGLNADASLDLFRNEPCHGLTRMHCDWACGSQSRVLFAGGFRVQRSKPCNGDAAKPRVFR